MHTTWHVLDLNPEPWAIGPLGVVKSGGKFVPRIQRNAQLAAFQASVKEALGEQLEITGKVELVLYFWRQQAAYETHQARTVRKHEADSTNMQKAIEDALQGVFFKNDKDVSDIRSVIVEQGPDVTPRIILRVGPWGGFDPTEIPAEVWARAEKAPDLFDVDNVWPPRPQEPKLKVVTFIYEGPTPDMSYPGHEGHTLEESARGTCCLTCIEKWLSQ